MADWSHCKLAGSGLPLLWLPCRAAGALGAVAGLTARPLAAGSPGPRGVGRSLWPGFLVCGKPGWPPPSGLDVFLGNFGALELRAGSALTSSLKALSGPWGPGTTQCGPKGVQRAREAKDASPSREWAADRGPSNFGGPRAARGAQVRDASHCERSAPTPDIC